jgi:hypothetical protein
MPVLVWMVGSIWALVVIAAAAILVVGSVEAVLSLFAR